MPRVINRFRRTHRALMAARHSKDGAWLLIMRAMQGDEQAKIRIILAFKARHVWRKL